MISGLEIPHITQVASPLGTLAKTFTCVANGSGVLSYTWFIDGIFSTRGNNVVVKNGDVGGGVSVVQCVVANGVFTMTQKLTINFECKFSIYCFILLINFFEARFPPSANWAVFF